MSGPGSDDGQVSDDPAERSAVELERTKMELSALRDEHKQLREKYEHLMRYAPSGVYEVDFINQRFVTFNDAIIRYSGYTKEEFEKLSPSDILTHESVMAFIDRLGKVIEGEDVPDSVEYEIMTKDGCVVPVVINPTYLRDPEGAVTGAFVIAHDRREIKMMEDALFTKEEENRLIVENANEAIFLVQDDVIVFCNERLIGLSGHTREELVGASPTMLVHPDDLNRMLEDLKDVITGRSEYHVGAYQAMTKTGEALWMEVKAIRVNWQGRPARLYFASDISQRVKATADLERERRLAEFYLDLLSHDIGNIHQGIAGWLFISKSARRDPSILKHATLNMESLLKRSTHLVKNVLTLSRILKSEPQLERIELRSVLDRSVKDAVELIPHKKPSIGYDPSGENIFFLAEPIVTELFINLLQNSLKFQDTDRPRIEIEVASDRCDGHVKVTIRDHGIGMPEDLKASINDVIEPQVMKRHSGTGLSIVKELVRRYTGTIHVEDAVEGDPSQGTIVTVTLPRSN